MKPLQGQGLVRLRKSPPCCLVMMVVFCLFLRPFLAGRFVIVGVLVRLVGCMIVRAVRMSMSVGVLMGVDEIAVAVLM